MGEFWKKWGLGKSGKIRSITEGGRGVFISDVCDEVISAEKLGYETAEAVRA